MKKIYKQVNSWDQELHVSYHIVAMLGLSNDLQKINLIQFA
jgi:hypothetical protein